MTENTPFFRQEAVDYWTGQRAPDGVLRIGAPWVRWLYWAVVALVVVGLAAAYAVRTEETASGPALLDPGERSFVATLPVSAGSELDRSPDVRIEHADESLPARILRSESADSADLRGRDLPSLPGPAILVTGALIGDTTGPRSGSRSPVRARVVVVTSRDRLLSTLWRGLNGGL